MKRIYNLKYVLVLSLLNALKINRDITMFDTNTIFGFILRIVSILSLYEIKWQYIE
jgi:hypothetical protein